MSPVRTAATVVVLAAGGGSRFAGDGPKLGQPLGASSVLAHTLNAVVASGLPLVVVTVAALVDQAQRVVASRDIVLLPPVGSPSREPLGVGYSIAAGVSARAQAGGWLVLPADMPLLQPDSLRAVARALACSPVAYAQHQGRQGFPVGFSGELYSELARLSGDEGVRRLLARYPSAAVEVEDPGVLFDVNTVDDLDRARRSVAIADLQ
jgi:molybdenum cofactor cytidylyltransferase